MAIEMDINYWFDRKIQFICLQKLRNQKTTWYNEDICTFVLKMHNSFNIS